MSKIYVNWEEGDYGTSGYVICAGNDKLTLVKKTLKERNENSEIKVYDSDTMELLFDCRSLHQYTDHSWCNCPECKDNDETVRYLVETKQGNYHK